MTTTPVSNASSNQNLQSYFQTRNQDMRQLGQALKTGDLARAQQAYQAIVALGQSGPFPNGSPFYVPAREQDFQAIGQALQSGDLAGAQQALATLRSTFRHPSPVVGPSNPGAGPDVIVNLSATSRTD